MDKKPATKKKLKLKVLTKEEAELKRFKKQTPVLTKEQLLKNSVGNLKTLLKENKIRGIEKKNKEKLVELIEQNRSKIDFSKLPPSKEELKELAKLEKKAQRSREKKEKEKELNKFIAEKEKSKQEKEQKKKETKEMLEKKTSAYGTMGEVPESKRMGLYKKIMRNWNLKNTGYNFEYLNLNNVVEIQENEDDYMEWFSAMELKIFEELVEEVVKQRNPNLDFRPPFHGSDMPLEKNRRIIYHPNYVIPFYENGRSQYDKTEEQLEAMVQKWKNVKKDVEEKHIIGEKVWAPIPGRARKGYYDYKTNFTLYQGYSSDSEEAKSFDYEGEIITQDLINEEIAYRMRFDYGGRYLKFADNPRNHYRIINKRANTIRTISTEQYIKNIDTWTFINSVYQDMRKMEEQFIRDNYPVLEEGFDTDQLDPDDIVGLVDLQEDGKLEGEIKKYYNLTKNIQPQDNKEWYEDTSNYSL